MCPHVRQSRKWTHGEPVRRHSSQPSGVLGVTGRIIVTCGHGTTLMSTPLGRPALPSTGPRLSVRGMTTTVDTETPDLYGAFPRLTDEQIEALLPHGERRQVGAGDVLFREGEDSSELFVIRAGQVALVEGHGTPGERVISVHGPGRFLGEVNLLTGQASVTTAVVTEPGEVLALPADTVRDLAAEDTRFGDLLLRVCMLRRSLLMGLGAGLRIIGSRYSPDTRRLREFAARNRIPHVWTDLEQDPTAEAMLRELQVAPEETPVVIWGGNRVLRNPANAELGRMIGLRSAPPRGG